MTRTQISLRTAALIAALFSAQIARAETEGSTDAATTATVTTALTAQGYDVRKLAMEDGAIEVYAVKDGKTCEVYLAPDLTAGVKVDHEICN